MRMRPQCSTPFAAKDKVVDETEDGLDGKGSEDGETDDGVSATQLFSGEGPDRVSENDQMRGRKENAGKEDPRNWRRWQDRCLIRNRPLQSQMRAFASRRGTRPGLGTKKLGWRWRRKGREF